MAVTRWVFEDPVTLATYNFEVNPSDGGSPQYSKNISYSSTSAPGGKVIVFEGRDKPLTLEFSGVILTQAHYDAFVTWFQKRYQVNVTDDLGRQFSIIIESFSPKRERAVHSPWKHSYSVSATVVDWA